MAKIIVTGATGRQGGAAIRSLKLVQKPEAVTLYALTRNPNSAAARKLVEEGVHVIKGDMDDIDSLTNALEDMHRAFLVTDIQGGHVKEEEQGRAFVRAAKVAGLEHIVFSSVDGAERKSDVPHFESKYRIEKELKASGIGWTILRPVAYMENFSVKGGFARFLALGVFHTGLGGKPLQWVSLKDIGLFAAQALLKPDEYQGKEIGLAGDELTIPQICAVYGKVQYGGRWNAWKAWIPRFLLWLLPSDLRKMLQFFRERGYTVDIPALRQEHPKLQTFEDYLRDESNVD